MRTGLVVDASLSMMARRSWLRSRIVWTWALLGAGSVGCDDQPIIHPIDGGSAADTPPADGPTWEGGSLDGADSGPIVCGPSEPPISDPGAQARATCAFAAGARVRDTLGVTPELRQALPIRNIVVYMQENRSFDHYFGRLPQWGRPDVDGIPDGYTNPDKAGADVAPFHLTSTCLPADPPHQWDAVHAGWNGGAMNGFVRSAASAGGDGHYALGWYDQTDLPFYYWLATTFSQSDRHFASVLGGTWPNRDYLYAGTSAGVKNTDERILTGVPTVFDALDGAGVPWAVFADYPREDSLGWDKAHRGFFPAEDFFSRLADGTLPPVTFLDPTNGMDEHPPHDVQGGEAWSRRIYEAAVASPLWSGLAILLTYDEAGGLFDHVAPPPACLASPDQAAFDRLGIRVPLIVISPWARAAGLSHTVSEHASILRLIELLHDLPAFTGRDANASALLDLFDFSCPHLLVPPAAPMAGSGGCR